MSVILGLIFLVMMMGLGLWKNETAQIQKESLSTIDQRTVVLKMR